MVGERRRYNQMWRRSRYHDREQSSVLAVGGSRHATICWAMVRARDLDERTTTCAQLRVVSLADHFECGGAVLSARARFPVFLLARALCTHSCAYHVPAVADDALVLLEANGD